MSSRSDSNQRHVSVAEVTTVRSEPLAREASGDESPSLDEVQDRLILRTQAAKLVPCSVATLRRLETTVLRPILVDEKGVHWHSLKQVQAYAASLRPPVSEEGGGDGALTAAAFELFDAGSDAADVVKRLKIPSDAARRLQAEWADLRGVMLISGTTLSKIRRYRTTDDNAILTGEELLQFIEQIELPSCAVCRRMPSVCLRCYEHRPPRANELVALATRQRELRDAAALRRQEEDETYAQARERAVYDPRAAAAARAAEEARRADRRASKAAAAAATQSRMGMGAATTRPRAAAAAAGVSARDGASAKRAAGEGLSAPSDSVNAARAPTVSRAASDTRAADGITSPVHLASPSPSALNASYSPNPPLMSGARGDRAERRRSELPRKAGAGRVVPASETEQLLARSPLTQEERDAFAREAEAREQEKQS